MFCLLKPNALIFLTLLKFPNETNWTDISFLFMTWLVYYYLIRGTQRQFSETICSEEDLRSRIFGTFDVKFLACLPLLAFSNI